MLAVAVAGVALPARHRRPSGRSRADDPNHVAQDRVASPLLDRLVQPLREAVVGDAGEVLLVDAVVAVGDRELLGCASARARRTARSRWRCRRIRRGSGSAASSARPSPRLAQASIPPCSSSGCAVVCIRLAVVVSFSSFCQVPTAPRSCGSSCERGVDVTTTTAETVARRRSRGSRDMGLVKTNGAY